MDRLKGWSDRRFDAAVFGLALALRLAFTAYFAARGLEAAYGRDLYYSLAQSWLGWAPPSPMDATHPPLYTLAIAGVLWCFRSPNPLPVRLLQAVLSSAVCVLVRRLGTRLASPPAARLAAVWTAVDPALVFYSPQLQTETFFVFLEVLFFVRLYRCLDLPPGRPGPFAAAGLLGGLASLCRSVFAAYPAALIPALWLGRGGRGIWLPFVLLSMGWLSPIAVWTARNWAKHHELIPISAQMGWNLYEGFTTDREEVRRRPREMDEEAARRGIADDPLKKSRYFTAKTLGLIRDNPLGAARIAAGKAFLYWRPWPYDPYAPAQRAAMGVYFTALFAAAALGLFRVARRGGASDWGPVFALIVYLTVMHSLFFTGLRYRVPLEPFLCLLGAAGIAG